jgi:hypothetical protein
VLTLVSPPKGLKFATAAWNSGAPDAGTWYVSFVR